MGGPGHSLRGGSSSQPGFNSRKLVEQRLCLFQINGIEAFGEPAKDGRQKVPCFCAPAAFTPEPGKAHRGAQFQRLCPLRTATSTARSSSARPFITLTLRHQH